jgi:hypothetical protein
MQLGSGARTIQGVAPMALTGRRSLFEGRMGAFSGVSGGRQAQITALQRVFAQVAQALGGEGLPAPARPQPTKAVKVAPQQTPASKSRRFQQPDAAE